MDTHLKQKMINMKDLLQKITEKFGNDPIKNRYDLNFSGMKDNLKSFTYNDANTICCNCAASWAVLIIAIQLAIAVASSEDEDLNSMIMNGGKNAIKSWLLGVLDSVIGGVVDNSTITTFINLMATILVSVVGGVTFSISDWILSQGESDVINAWCQAVGCQTCGCYLSSCAPDRDGSDQSKDCCDKCCNLCEGTTCGIPTLCPFGVFYKKGSKTACCWDITHSSHDWCPWALSCGVC